MKATETSPLRQNMLREMKDYLMIALGMIMYGIGWTVFLLPNDITTGGVPGIASIVYFATGFPVQYTYFGINVLLLLLAIRILGWKFSIKTIFAVFTLTFFLSVIQKLTNGLVLLDDQPFMACVIGASFCGGGIGIAFSANGSTGGTDIIAAIINKYRDITLGRVMLICDLIIIRPVTSRCRTGKRLSTDTSPFTSVALCSTRWSTVPASRYSSSSSATSTRR